MSEWIDITTPIRDGMAHWPGDPDVMITRPYRLEAGDDYNLTQISMGAHTGTHVDAPLHFIRDGRSLDEMNLDGLIGSATVVDGVALPVRTEDRVLFRCGAEVTRDIAGDLVKRRARAVGIDSPSIGDAETHRLLLEAGIWIIEGLDLRAAPPGAYDLICLPLKIAGAEGAPARAVLRPR